MGLSSKMKTSKRDSDEATQKGSFSNKETSRRDSKKATQRGLSSYMETNGRDLEKATQRACPQTWKEVEETPKIQCKELVHKQ